MDLTTLLARCREGDPLAWEDLVRRFQGRVLGLAWHYVRNHEETRDVAQEIFIRLYERLDSFEGDTFVPWLLSLARNCCIDRLRRRKARGMGQTVPLDEEPQGATDEPDPEQSAERGERQRLLYRALARLSHDNREIILLKDIQGLKIEEISAMLALPEGTVKSRSSRARIELARRIRSLDPSWGT